MAFTGMMCVRDEEKWISRAIQSLTPVCDRVYVLDDHSIDRTVEIASRIPAVTLLHSPFTDRDEARDKTLLLNEIVDGESQSVKVGTKSPDWVIYIDGDEELASQDRDKLLSTLTHGVNDYCAQVLYLWDDEQTVRVDSHYLRVFRPTIFRLIQRGMIYQNHSGKIHSTGVPREIGYSSRRVHEPEPVRLLHYGYMEKAVREEKFERYMKIDPVQEAFYIRECFGPVKTAALSSILRTS